MSKPTPGPWRVTKTDTLFGVVADDGLRVVQTSWHGSIRNPYPLKPEAHANAHLIAAAPDMLAALREIETIITESASDCRRRMGTRQGNALVVARAAIAKAEARST